MTLPEAKSPYNSSVSLSASVLLSVIVCLISLYLDHIDVTLVSREG